jgi:hypothetical protein
MRRKDVAAAAPLPLSQSDRSVCPPRWSGGRNPCPPGSSPVSDAPRCRAPHRRGSSRGCGTAQASFGNRSCPGVRRSIPTLSRSISFEVRGRRRWPTGIEEIVCDSGPFNCCHSASLGGISESSLPTWLSRSACGRSRASVGMKRNWTSLKGVLRLYEQRWLVAYSTTHGRRTNQRGSAGASASLTRLVQISRPILSRVR